MGERDGSVDAEHCSGIFKIRVDTTLKRALKIYLGFPAGVALLAVGVAVIYEIVTGTVPPSDLTFSIFLVLAGLVGGPVLILLASTSISARPGLYLSGIRMTSAGFENGTLTVPLESIEPPVGSLSTPSAGKLLQGSWQAEPLRPSSDGPLEIGRDRLTMLVVLKQFGGGFYFRSFALLSGDNARVQVNSARTIAETNGDDIVSVVDGEFRLLGQMLAYRPSDLVPELERVAASLGHVEARQGRLPCTLVLLSKTVSMTQSILFGVVGAAVAGAVDAGNRAKLRHAFAENKLFPADVTKALLEFVDAHGWTITAGDQPKEQTAEV